MAAKENISVTLSGVMGAKADSAVIQARRDEMANAKEFDAGSVVTARAVKCTNRPRPGPCLHPPGSPCLVPPKCGPKPPPRPNVR